MNHDHTPSPDLPDAPWGGRTDPRALLKPPEDTPVWNDHDRLPEGGTWFYVTAPSTHARHPMTGTWVPADLDPHKVAMVVSSAVGQPVTRADLVVVDQMCMDAMVDEDHLAPERFRA